jgi:hypothetical protein
MVQWIDIGGVVEELPAIPFATSRTATLLTSTPTTRLFPNVLQTAGPKFVHYAVKHIHFLTTSHFRLYLPNVEMTLDLEVKALTSLASVTWITALDHRWQRGGGVSQAELGASARGHLAHRRFVYL